MLYFWLVGVQYIRFLALSSLAISSPSLCPRVTFDCSPTPTVCLPLFFSRLHVTFRLCLFVGGIGTPRWRESSGAASVTARHSAGPGFSAHLPPAALLGLHRDGQGGAWRGRSWSQPPPSTHGANGAEPQLNGSAATATFTKACSSSHPKISCFLQHVSLYFLF